MTEVIARDDIATRSGGGVSKHLLPPLPYDYEALEPHIDARTMMLHHGKHLASDVEKMNTALATFSDLQQRRSGCCLIWTSFPMTSAWPSATTRAGM